MLYFAWLFEALDVLSVLRTHYYFLLISYSKSKEHENLCNPHRERMASLSSLGSGGSGLFKSGGGSGGRGFELTAPGRKGNTISLVLLYWPDTSMRSDMM